MEKALEKLKAIKKVLDWNLSTKSQDILPHINEVIAMMESEIKQPTIQQVATKTVVQSIPTVSPLTQPQAAPVIVKIGESPEQAKAKAFLKEKGIKGVHLYKGDNIIKKAVENGFIN